MKIYTAGEHPLDYAQTQNNLGAVYKTLAEIENPGENLSKSIGNFEESLKIRTIDKYPFDYAHTQNNLGTTYGLLSTVHNMEENIVLDGEDCSGTIAAAQRSRMLHEIRSEQGKYNNFTWVLFFV